MPHCLSLLTTVTMASPCRTMVRIWRASPPAARSPERVREQPVTTPGSSVGSQRRLPRKPGRGRGSDFGRYVSFPALSCLQASSHGESESCRNERPSEELFDHGNRPVGANLSGANGKQPVQEGIFPFGSLEARHRTKVGSSWRSVVTAALERHVDEGAVVGLQRDACAA